MTGRAFILVVVVLALGGAVVYAVPRLEGDAPEIAEMTGRPIGHEPATLRVELLDAGAGLRHVEIRAQHAGGSTTLLSQDFSGSLLGGGPNDAEAIEILIDAGSLRVPDGPLTLLVIAHDWSWRGGLDGNRSEREVELTVDTVPPRPSVESGLTYIHRGGSGAIVYRLDGPAARDGMRVGDAFFPGHALGDGRRVALFAIPVDAPTSPDLEVVAVDEAGNAGRAGVRVKILDRNFPEKPIRLSQSFLEGIVVPLAREHQLEAGNPAQAFRQVNEALRARDEARIRELAAASSNQRHWSGAFEQLAGSTVTSGFAERRHYTDQGREISTATHFGFDLASTARAPVTAANAGVVVFAGDLGIYGTCVLLDHGLGLTSLYAHLSELDVAEGQSLAKGQRVGRSGSTGLAGGDHLHFAILVGETYVDPLEWWDPKWVREHVEVRLEADTG